ncbi:cell division protein ZapE [Aquibaculum sediminis]|uniref:cell division protein ZapE n=1 Tax=Aquibaculum sediminis TaxID=3231907 RepID=UPI0034556FF6
MSQGPIQAYREKLHAGEIKPDGGQELAAEKLQALHHALQDYQPAGGRTGWKERLGLARRREEPPQGLYLYGPVGRGKSMLMDLFFESAPVERKRRVHFHAFMAEVHERLHAWRARTRGAKADPLPDLAGELAEEAWLLCFDEFVVINIADAMILARLFESLFDRGVVVVATSNFEPDRLYEDGLQREHFLPFIALLKERLDVLDLGAGTDYRLDRLKQRPVFHHPLGPEAERFAEKAFAELTEGAEPKPGSLTIKGRKLAIPATAHGVARFAFAELCEQPLGASDYLTLATHFRALVLEGVPVMGPDQRNAARRFMHLIDALYEHCCKLVMTAAGPPEALYPEGDGSFEFTRTVSRLAEMQSVDYLERAHLT